MNLTTLLSTIRTQLFKDSTSQGYSDAQILLQINQGYQKIWDAKDWLWSLADTSVNLYYTTVSSTSTGTTLNAITGTGALPNQQVIVSDGENTETVIVASVILNTITLVYPGLLNSYAADSIISSMSIAKPAGFNKFVEVMTLNNDNQALYSRLTPISWKDINFCYANKMVGVPTYYCEDISSIKIYPPPNSDAYSVTLRYKKDLTELSLATPTGSPIFPTSYHNLLVFYACAQLQLQEERINGYNLFMSEFERGIQKMLSDDNKMYDGQLRMTNWKDRPATYEW